MNHLVIFMCRDVYNVGEHYTTLLHNNSNYRRTDFTHSKRKKKKVSVIVFCRHEFCSGYFNVGLNEVNTTSTETEIAFASYSMNIRVLMLYNIHSISLNQL